MPIAIGWLRRALIVDDVTLAALRGERRRNPPIESRPFTGPFVDRASISMIGRLFECAADDWWVRSEERLEHEQRPSMSIGYSGSTPT